MKSWRFHVLLTVHGKRGKKIGLLRLIKVKHCLWSLADWWINWWAWWLAGGWKDTVCAYTYLFSCMFIQISPPNFPAQRIYTWWFFRHSGDAVMEQVKQTFDVSLSLSFLLTTSPPQSIAALANLRLAHLDAPIARLSEHACWSFSSRDLLIVRSVELLFVRVEVLRKQSEARERTVIVEQSALWERRASTQFFSTYLFRSRRECEYVCVCAHSYV